jgi:hypothetical protein
LAPHIVSRRLHYIGVLAGLALGMAACFVAPAPAATLSVRTTGSDGSACTPAAPCLSLGRAYRVASPGDTVLVGAGSYPSQTVDSDAGKEGAVPPVLIRPEPGASVTLGDLSTYASNVHYTGFVFPSGGGEPTVLGGHDVVLEGMRARNFYVRGSTNRTPPSRVTILGGEFGPFPSCGGGAQITAANVDERDPAKMPSDIVVDGIYIHDYSVPSSCPGAHLDCMHVFSVLRVTVRNSTFTRCEHYGILLNSNGAGLADGHLIENNFFGATGIAGFALRGGDGEDFENVTVRYNSGGLITPQTDNVLRNVRWVANAATDFGGCRSGISYEYNVSPRQACSSTDLRANPGFANAAQDDFHLVAGAAAIDRGKPGEFPATDRDGDERIFGPAPDAGADEWGARPRGGGGGSGSGSGQPPGSAVARGQILRLRSKILVGRHGRLRVRVRCVTTAGAGHRTCLVKLRIRARLPGHRGVIRIARMSTRVVPGRARTLRVRLVRSARRALRRGRTLRATVLLSVRDASGQTDTQRKRVRIRRR